MRAIEVHAILDCAELAARASLYRTESRWGLYHHRTDFPEKNNDDWFTFVEVRKGADGQPEIFRRPVPPYLFPIEEDERDAYDRLRIEDPAAVRIGAHA